MTAPHGMHLPGQAPAVVAILVVDGDEETRTATVLALEPLGHTIVEARSGEAALSALTQRTFAVILMDVELPGINGYEVVERIRMRSASEYTPLILMASPARDEARVPDRLCERRHGLRRRARRPGDPAREGLGVCRPVRQDARARTGGLARQGAQRGVPRQRGAHPGGARARRRRHRHRHERRNGRDRQSRRGGDVRLRRGRGDRQVVRSHDRLRAVTGVPRRADDPGAARPARRGRPHGRVVRPAQGRRRRFR